MPKVSTQFLHKPSPLCCEAAALLTRLRLAEGSDIVGRVTAGVLTETALAEFARSRKIRQRRGGHVCLSRLLGKRCKVEEDNNIPASDHLSEWCQGRDTVAIVSQPYGLHFEQIKETMEFCAKVGLWVEIDTWPSWHFPGSVLTVIFTRQGTRLSPHGLEHVTP